MKLQIASDLHLEHLARHFPGCRLIEPAPSADLLILAGDIHSGVLAVETFADWPVPVLYVSGNHEHYGWNIDANQANIHAAARGTAVRVLDDDSCVLGGVRFLGATLWTDYRFYPNIPRERALVVAQHGVADHRFIGRDGQYFRPSDALQEHERSAGWLREQLGAVTAEKTVVITHHAPHEGSIHARWQGNPFNLCFGSKLGHLVQRADLWVHGHMHDSFDYRVGQCRVVCNPRGYPMGRAKAVEELVFENPHFQPQLVVEV